MHTVTLTLALTSEAALSVRFDSGTSLFEARIDGDALLATSDMADAFRMGAAPPGVVRALTSAMAAVLFAGEVGPGLKQSLERADERALLLELDARLAAWPWELALGEAVCTVRVSGKPRRAEATTVRSTLAFPGGGQSRSDAVIAATRTLGRKHGLDIAPLPHTTGPALRRALESGALLLHLEAQGEEDTVQLDDGAVPVDRLGVSASTWLVVLWAPRLSPGAPLKLRAQGAGVVVSVQAPLDLASKGIFVRELYRSLGAGASVAEAVHRARRALSAALGTETGLWAAPIVHTAPGAEGAPPALTPFPPPAHDAPPAPELRASSPADARPTRWGLSWPQTCAVFIYDTLRALSDLTSPSEAEARVEVLRALGGQLTLSEAAPPEVDSPEERTRWLADRLLASLVREDTPLVTINAGDAAHATRIAEAYGIASECIVRLSGALERGVPVALTGLDWPRRADLVRDVAALFFGCGALPIPNDETSVWFDELVALHWVREQLDSLNMVPAALPGRAPLIGRSHDGAFCVHRGVWAVLEPRSPQQLDAALDLVAATARGARLSRGHDQRPRRMPIPQEFRVVLSTDALPAGWPSTFAHIHLAGAHPVS